MKMIYHSFFTILWSLSLFQNGYSSLTTFQPSSLNIRLNNPPFPSNSFSTNPATSSSTDKPHQQQPQQHPPPKNLEILYEAIHLLQNHFIYRDRYQPSDWENFKQEFSQYSDSREGIKELMRRLNEPYTRYIEYNAMKDRRRALTGVAISPGVSFHRKLHLEDWKFAIKSIFFPSTDFTQSFQLHLRYWFKNLFSNRFQQEIDGKFPSISSSKYHQAVVEESLLPTWSSQKELLMELLGYGKNYFLLSFSTLSAAFAPRKDWLLVLLTTSVCAISFGSQMAPVLYPYEVASICTKEAQAAGIKEGDRLIAIDGKKIQKLTGREVKKLLNTGEVGDKMLLQIVRKQWREITTDTTVGDLTALTATTSQSIPPPYIPQLKSPIMGMIARIQSFHRQNRESLKIQYQEKVVELVKNFVDSTKLDYYTLPLRQGRGLGYVHIKEFNDKTFSEFKHALDDLNRQLKQEQLSPLKALLVDIRGNPGGPVSSALDVAAIFLRRGKSLLQMSIHGKLEHHYSKNDRPDEKTSILLLTDSNTASASEMLVEALCTNGRAISMGRKTVGKNFAQVMTSLSDGSGLCFTVREFFAPDGRSMSEGHIPKIYTTDEIDISSIRWNETSGSWIPFPSNLVASSTAQTISNWNTFSFLS